MLKKNVQIGGIYACKISGQLAIVQVTQEVVPRVRLHRARRTKFMIHNLKTGRTTQRTAAALRALRPQLVKNAATVYSKKLTLSVTND